MCTHPLPFDSRDPLVVLPCASVPSSVAFSSVASNIATNDHLSMRQKTGRNYSDNIKATEPSPPIWFLQSCIHTKIRYEGKTLIS